MVLEILDTDTNTYVDITPYIAYGGIKWQRADVDGTGAGRAINGNVMRNRIATKYRLDCTCRPLFQSEAQVLLSLIQPEFVTVNYTDPNLGNRNGVVMYSNNIPATYAMKNSDGEDVWSGITFPLIEK